VGIPYASGVRGGDGFKTFRKRYFIHLFVVLVIVLVGIGTR